MSTYFLFAVHNPKGCRPWVKNLEPEMMYCYGARDNRNLDLVNSSNYKEGGSSAVERLKKWLDETFDLLPSERKVVIVMDFNFGFSGYDVSVLSHIASHLGSSRLRHTYFAPVGTGGMDLNREMEEDAKLFLRANYNEIVTEGVKDAEGKILFNLKPGIKIFRLTQLDELKEELREKIQKQEVASKFFGKSEEIEKKSTIAPAVSHFRKKKL